MRRRGDRAHRRQPATEGIDPGDPVGGGNAPSSRATSAIWFPSFQNWQREFLAVGALSALSVLLRQKGSPESKPVADPNRSTGAS